MKINILSWNSVALATATAFSSFPTIVNGHAFMWEPETRNWVASNEGTWGSAAGVPPAESTPQGLNSNTNVCGKEGGSKDYDEWLDSTGKPMQWQSRTIYSKGEEIRVDVKVTAHHYGHFELKACPLGRSSTQDCFDANPLTFVHEITDGRKGMPKDENYPHRAMLYGDGRNLSYKFKLPDNIVGEEVLLQWIYWTANNCNYDGYNEYFSTKDVPPASNGSWNSGLSGCGDQSQIPITRKGTVIAEIFVNCAEVTILEEGEAPPVPNPTPIVAAPTPVPIVTTEAPVPMDPIAPPKPPVGTGTGEACCSQNYKTCAGWGGSTIDSCESMGSMKWLENGPIDSECLGKDSGCTNTVDSCCPGLICSGTEWYKSCKPDNVGRRRRNNVRSF